MNAPRCGRACSSVSKAASSLRWRQEAQDQFRVDAELALRARARGGQARDHGRHRHAALGVRLRIEEQLGAQHPVGVGALEVRPGHVVEVLLVQQHAGPGVVDVEEGLQVGEGVGRAQRLDARIGEREPVPLRQRENEFRLERALDVDVELGLGQAACVRLEFRP
jgi:hypothetical protein